MSINKYEEPVIDNKRYLLSMNGTINMKNNFGNNPSLIRKIVRN
jgi:hypothetical protein